MHCILGAILGERGDVTGAVRLFAAALKIDPSDAGAKANLQQALRIGIVEGGAPGSMNKMKASLMTMTGQRITITCASLNLGVFGVMWCSGADLDLTGRVQKSKIDDT